MHWTTESVYSDEVGVPIGDEVITIAVRAEVPMEGNTRLPRRGHRYFPTLIDVEVPESGEVTLHSDTARELAQKLIAAADAADAIDTPDTDTCGHWAPCGYCLGRGGDAGAGP